MESDPSVRDNTSRVFTEKVTISAMSWEGTYFQPEEHVDIARNIKNVFRFSFIPPPAGFSTGKNKMN